MNLRHFGIALVTFGLVVAMPVAAERVQTTNPGPHAAQISGTPGKVTEDIFPVRIAQINGRNIHPRETLWLEPGRYEFRVQVDIPSGALGPRQGIDSLRWRSASAEARREAMTIELEVEAGNTYQIRARFNRQGGDNLSWSTVLWRVD